jgi:hypothetical protein
LKTAEATERRPGRADATAADCGLDCGRGATVAQRAGTAIRAGTVNLAPVPNAMSSAPPPRQIGLSVRAENVLKQLAAELTGENPPKGRWVPPDRLLRKLRFRDLSTARNCGPQTRDEIVRWAGSQGVVILQPGEAGMPLSAMWRDLVARSSREECTKAEIAEALQTSARRGNTRIPVAFQSLVVKVLKSGN